jgi:hypothetical protein
VPGHASQVPTASGDLRQVPTVYAIDCILLIKNDAVKQMSSGNGQTAQNRTRGYFDCFCAIYPNAGTGPGVFHAYLMQICMRAFAALFMHSFARICID